MNPTYQNNYLFNFLSHSIQFNFKLNQSNVHIYLFVMNPAHKINIYSAFPPFNVLFHVFDKKKCKIMVKLISYTKVIIETLNPGFNLIRVEAFQLLILVPINFGLKKLWFNNDMFQSGFS